MRTEQLLDLSREHVLATRDDHLVVTPVDVQPTVGVEVTDVARGHQAREHVLVAAAGVSLELGEVADEDPPGLTL